MPVARLPSAERAADLREGSPGRGRLQERLGDEGARAGAESGPGPCACADVPEPLDRSPVAGPRRERAPEEVLVERERAAVWIAVPQVDVQLLDVRRREYDAVEQARVEIRNVRGEPRLDAVGIVLAQTLRPHAVAHVEVARGVALDTPRQLLQLHPEEPLPVGRA